MARNGESKRKAGRLVETFLDPLFSKKSLNEVDALEKYDMVFIFNSHSKPLSKQERKSLLAPKHFSEAAELDTEDRSHLEATAMQDKDLKVWELFRAAFDESMFDIACLDSHTGEECLKDVDKNSSIYALGVAWKLKGLLEYADVMMYPLQLSPEQLEDRLNIGYDEPAADTPPAFVPYQQSLHEMFAIVTGSNGCTEVNHSAKSSRLLRASISGDIPVMDSRDRLRLLWTHIAERLNYVQCQRLGLLTSVVCPHDKARMAEFFSNMRWTNLFDPRCIHRLSLLSPFDINSIVMYFGRRIGFYFIYLLFNYSITMWYSILLLFAFGGAHAGSYCYPELSFREWMQVIWVLPSCFFGVVFVSLWDRSERWKALCWGAIGVVSYEEEVMQCNPADCEQQLLEVNHRQRTFVPNKRRAAMGRCLSPMISALYLSLALSVTYAMQFYLAPWVVDLIGAEEAATHLVATMVTVSSLIVSKIYQFVVAPKLTNMEMHKYLIDHERAQNDRINKITILNFFGPLLYIVLGWSRSESPGDMLAVQFRTWLLTNLVLCWLFDLMPLMYMHIGAHFTGHAPLSELGRLDTELLMEEYGGEELAGDYVELLGPVCGVMVFGWADPILSPCILMVTMLTNLISDVYKVLKTCRRPLPMKAKGIGLLRVKLLRICAFLGIVTNWALFWRLGPETAHAKFAKLVNLTPNGAFLLGLSVVGVTGIAIERMIPTKSEKTKRLESRHRWQQQQISRLLEDMQAGNLHSFHARCKHDDDHPLPPLLPSKKDQMKLHADRGMCSDRSGTFSEQLHTE